MAIYRMNQKKLMPLRYPHGAKNAVRPPPPPPLKLWDVVDGWIVYWLDEANNIAWLVAPASERLWDDYADAWDDAVIPGIHPQVHLEGEDPYSGRHNTEILRQEYEPLKPYSVCARSIAEKSAFWPNIQELRQLLQSDLDRIDVADTSGGTYTFAEIRRLAHNGRGSVVISSSQHGADRCLSIYGHNPYVAVSYRKYDTGFVIGIRELPIVAA